MFSLQENKDLVNVNTECHSHLGLLSCPLEIGISLHKNCGRIFGLHCLPGRDFLNPFPNTPF